MSRRFAKKMMDLYELNVVPTSNPLIRWTKGKTNESFYTFLVPYDVTVGRGGKVADITPLTETEQKYFFQIQIKEMDLIRMVSADKVSDELYFSFMTEQGNLTDVVYYCVSLIQNFWYLSKSVLDEARRSNKRTGYPQWINLKRRINKGGQRRNVPKKERVMSEEEKERLISLIENYDVILNNCIKHDWLEEYYQLERDIAHHKGTKPLTKKQYTKKFSEMRKKYFN